MTIRRVVVVGSAVLALVFPSAQLLCAQPPGGPGPSQSLSQRVEALETSVASLGAGLADLQIDMANLAARFEDLEAGLGKSLVVIDATGKRVGTPIGVLNFGDIFVALEANGVVFVVAVSKNGFVESAALGFESNDCTGPAHVFQTTNLLPGVAIAPPGQTAYVQSGPPQTIVLRSIFRQGACSNVGPATQEWAPASPLVDLSTIFNPPFDVALR